MAFLTGQRLTADLLNQNLQGVTTSVVADSATFSTTETVLATWSAPLVSGQAYAVVADMSMRSTVQAVAEAALVRIREDTLTGNQIQGFNYPLVSSNTAGNPVHVYSEYVAVSTATKTFVLTAIRNGSGTGTYNLKASANSPCLFRIQPLVN